jgi:hypothetical protein
MIIRKRDGHNWIEQMMGMWSQLQLFVDHSWSSGTQKIGGFTPKVLEEIQIHVSENL